MGEEFAETVETLNGRQIRRLGPGGCYGWMVETRGPEWHGQCLQVWLKRDTIEAAREEATRLGPMPATSET